MTDISFFSIAAIVLTLAAVFGYVNFRWMRLPHSIGLVVIALFASLGGIGLDARFPGVEMQTAGRSVLGPIDFN